jgi:hypothetical protein
LAELLSNGYGVSGLIFAALLVAPMALKVSLSKNQLGGVRYGVHCQFALGLLGMVFQEANGRKKLQICLLKIPLNIWPVVGWLSKKPKEKKAQKFQNTKLWIRYFWRERRRFFRYMKKLKTFFLLDYLKGKIKFGFTDPVLTGQIYGVLCILNSQKRRKFQFDMKPEFMDPCFIGDFSGRIVFFPFWVLVLGFFHYYGQGAKRD